MNDKENKIILVQTPLFFSDIENLKTKTGKDSYKDALAEAVFYYLENKR
jgi:hypothetical protein